MNFFILVLIFLSIINNFDSFHFKTKIRKNKKTLKASLEGIELGLITIGTGLLMDNTISKNSLQVLKNNSTILYNEGMRKVYTNLIFIGPIYYFR